MPAILRDLAQLPERAAFAAVDAWARRELPTLLDFLRSREGGHTRRYEIALPRCANDKFAWRKIFDHDPRHVILSDKLACKAWVAAQGLDLRIARVLWQGTDARSIPASLLAADVVIKANHGCGTNIMIRSGRPDRRKPREVANRFLMRDHGRWAWQWGYFNVERRLFVEEMIGDGDLMELKFYTFGRRVERLVAIAGRFGAMSASVFEPERAGKLRPVDRPAAVAARPLARPLPSALDRATDIARSLGAPFDHMRVDLLWDGRELWFGEMTVYNLGGHISHTGTDPQAQIARAWGIRRSWFLTTQQHGWGRLYAVLLRRALARPEHGTPPLPPA